MRIHAFKTRWTLSGIGVCLVMLCASPLAHAVAFVRCGGQPFAFKDAEINVVILPYFQAGQAQHDLNGLGSQLALLVKLDTLYRAMAYDRWGIILLTGRKEECNPEKIASDLIPSMIPPGGRLIVIWGKLYQQDENVYVQTFVRFYQAPRGASPSKEVAPTFEVPIGENKFEGQVASEFSFPPEQLPIQVMQDIENGFEKSVFLYDAPDLQSTKSRLPLDDFRKCDQCHDALAFTVDGRKDGWVRVRKQDNKVGYLLAQIPEGMDLSQHLSELLFIQGLMGYERYTGSTGTADMSATEVAEKALVDYAMREGSEQEPESKAGALELSGLLRFMRGEKDASDAFDRAYALVPYSSDIRNCAALFRVYRDYNLPDRKIRAQEIARDFVAAAALDPSNSMVLQNLESFYDLLLSPAVSHKIDLASAINPDEIHKQVARLKLIRANLAKQNAGDE
jgi:hypothetical protein